jgi:hypothetical protein
MVNSVVSLKLFSPRRFPNAVKNWRVFLESGFAGFIFVHHVKWLRSDLCGV